MTNTPHSKTLNGSASFEAWQKRPVYVAQCHTAKLASKLGIKGYWFRCLPDFRDPRAKADRMQIAQAVRVERNRLSQLKAVIAQLDIVQQHNPETGYLVDVQATIDFRIEMHRLQDVQSPAYKSLGQTNI